jgi:DNA polymerase III sliding clamp (beta) subunit (PCNA family)
MLTFHSLLCVGVAAVCARTDRADQGDALEIGFNAAYLLEVLKYMPTEDVRMTFVGGERYAAAHGMHSPRRTAGSRR